MNEDEEIKNLVGEPYLNNIHKLKYGGAIDSSGIIREALTKSESENVKCEHQEDKTNSFGKHYEKLLNDSDKDTFTKLELSETFLEAIDCLIEDWILVRQVIKRGIEKLEVELQDKESV